jgi:hypothetical protein
MQILMITQQLSSRSLGPLHNSLCKKFANLSSRPQAPSKLAILLSDDDPEPRLVWVPCPKANRQNSSTTFDSPVVVPLLGSPITHAAERFNIAKNEARGFDLDHTVILHARDNWLNDGSKPNQAALALTDWELPYDWRGNILIMSYRGMAGAEFPVQAAPGIPDFLKLLLKEEGGQLEPYKDYQDVTLADLRTAVDYLSSYGVHVERGTEHSYLEVTNDQGEIIGEKTEFQKLLEKASEAEKGGKIKGVLIRCEGDIELHRKQTKIWERYSEVEVAMNHPICKSVLM